MVLQEKLPFPYDLEKVIDDWVMMGFLVGNDFIPNLPHLHINHDALPLLWRTYIEILPSCGGESCNSSAVSGMCHLLTFSVGIPTRGYHSSCFTCTTVCSFWLLIPFCSLP